MIFRKVRIELGIYSMHKLITIFIDSNHEFIIFRL